MTPRADTGLEPSASQRLDAQSSARSDPVGDATGEAALLALDWGTTRLRGFLMGAQGQVLAERDVPRGLRHLAWKGPAGYEAALTEVAGDWLRARPGLPVVACGMVGSAQGWVEAGYVNCPASLDDLAHSAARVDSQVAGTVRIVPGLKRLPGHPTGELPDVMRGEETQIAGALLNRPDWQQAACLILPGTHAKWAMVSGGRVADFHTAMTGELYAVLCQHSLLGALMPAEEGAPDPAAAAGADAGFARGVALARSSDGRDLTHQLFGTRTLGLTGGLPPEALSAFLSGLLIGHELVSGLARRARSQAHDAPLILVGDDALCARYVQALALFGEMPAAVLGNTASAGLFAWAGSLGLLATPHDPNPMA